MDLVTLMHPDLELEEDTTFFRMFPPPINTTGVPSCPRKRLPVRPEQGTIHISSRFIVDVDASTSRTIDASYFAVLDRLYPTANENIANALGVVNVADLEMVMTNSEQQSLSRIGIDATVRVPNCKAHSLLWTPAEFPAEFPVEWK
mmetsp:Transcript_21150/g.58801  ORF Transcript_21150/g.58801 Transcript_21150/m.58801 type:complete len:146 (+) Transcript_21150:3242-3679(+)